MKKYVLITTLVFSLKSNAQNNLIFDTSKVDGNTKLIGRYPQYDKHKTYKDLNFIIENPIIIKKVISTLSLEKEGKNMMEDPDFRITIVKNFDEVESWIVSPGLNKINYDGITYDFDINKLKELAKIYPFDYRFDKIPFKSKAEYNKYLEKQKADKSFLFAYAPEFKYEGSFEVQFPRNQIFPSPQAISDYLTPFIEKIESKDEYTLSYVLTEKNLKDQSQFTMTITGSKKLYEMLQLDKLRKGNWESNVEEGWFFYRTK